MSQDHFSLRSRRVNLDLIFRRGILSSAYLTHRKRESHDQSSCDHRSWTGAVGNRTLVATPDKHYPNTNPPSTQLFAPMSLIDFKTYAATEDTSHRDTIQPYQLETYAVTIIDDDRRARDTRTRQKIVATKQTI